MLPYNVRFLLDGKPQWQTVVASCSSLARAMIEQQHKECLITAILPVPPVRCRFPRRTDPGFPLRTDPALMLV